MELLLAIAAIGTGIAACVVAARSTAAARRLALEMVQLRDRLARAERHYRDRDGEEGGRRADAPAADAEALRSRVAELEGRLREALVEPLTSAPETDPVAETDEERARILRHLRREGYERVAFLGATEGGGWLVEAERGGVTDKGRAEIRADGSVHVRAVSSVRAFP